MKKLVSFLFVLLIILSSLFFVHAHSGKTDNNGGHNSSSGYHYHHGYPAHQHQNGECPYDFDDKTGSNSGSSSSGSNSSKSTTNSGTSNSIPSFFDTLKQQTLERELEEYKSLSNNRLIYVVCLFIILVFLIVILIHNNNKKNKAQEEANKHKRNLETEIEKVKKEINYLRSEYNKKSDLCYYLTLENEKLKKEIIEIDSSYFVEVDNEKLKIRKYIASHLGLVVFRIYPDESISDYFIRIFESGNKNPFHFANPQFRGRKHEVQSLKYADFIKEKYEAKGYEITLFESKCTTEKYLFASNSTNKILIQCILTQDELSDVEHVQALNNTLIDLETINSIDNIKAVLICSCSISDEVKGLLHMHNFNYRENIELNTK